MRVEHCDVAIERGDRDMFSIGRILNTKSIDPMLDGRHVPDLVEFEFQISVLNQ